MSDQTSSDQKNSSSNQFKGLDNKQIALVYYRFLAYQKKLKKFIETGMMPKDISSPMGPITVMVSAKPEEIQEFENSEYFSICNSIVTSLKHIVELIEESDEEVKKLQEILK
jgi:hypothetical protein